jgi:putative membrane protein
LLEKVGELAVDARMGWAGVVRPQPERQKARTMDRREVLMALAGAVSLSPAAAVAQGMPAPRAVSPDRYRMMALMGGDSAIETSRLALERSRNPSVRRFAALEIDEQTAVAASLGARPGRAPLRHDQVAVIRQLAATPPSPRFDWAYIQGQMVGHRELLAVHGGYLRSPSRDNVGTAVANLAVPTIQTHLAVLGNLQRSGGLST